MALVSKKGAMKVKAELFGISGEDNHIAKDFFHQVQDFHKLDEQFSIYDIEKRMLAQMEWEVGLIKRKPTYDTTVPRFNPSGASKCPRELFLKLTGAEQDEGMFHPYHKRWTRNAEAVHQAMQKDMLYMERLLKNPLFKVKSVADVLGKDIEAKRKNLPAWERNLLSWKEFNHKGQKFIINGMMDGVLEYTPEQKMVGFEFKTKSTTIATVGTFKMKDVQPAHREQCVAYSCLFFGDVYEDRTDTFIVMYESLAKDGWTKGAEAREDFRTFQVHVSLEQRMELLDKFSLVSKMVQENNLPSGDTEKCFFCPFKSFCEGDGE